MRHLSITLATILPITLLTACGGGSSNGSNGPESTYSIGGTASGALTQGLTLENNGSDSLPVAGVSFEFNTQLANGDNYDVTVSAHPDQQLCSVTDGSGVVAGADVDNIAVLCRYWRAETLIENLNIGHSRFPQVATDGNGNTLAVWRTNDGSYESLYANYYDASTGNWGTETLIESGNAGHAVSPAIAFDNSGNATVVWAQHDGTNYNIYANRYSPSTGWGTEALIESGNAGDAASPQIAFDDNGNAIAIWTQNDGTHDSVYANRYTPANGWGAEELIETGNSGDATQPKIAFDNAGNAIATWSQDTGGYNDVLTNRYTPASGWGSETLVADGNQGGAFDPQIALDANGNGTLVWREHDGAKDSLYASRYTASTDSWGAEVLLENGNNGHARTPRVAVDNDGNAIAVWAQEEISIRTSIYANRYTAATDSWGSETLLESGEDGHARQPQIVINEDGNALVVWMQSDSVSSNLLYTNIYIAQTGTWGTEALVENTTTAAEHPQLVMDDHGNATVVTQRFDGSNLNIHANRFE